MVGFDELIAKLQNGAPQEKADAAAELGHLKDIRAIHLLRENLKSKDVAVRDNCAYALAEIGAKESTKDLIKLLDDESKLVRKSAAKGLGMLKATEAVDALSKKIDDDSYLVRKSVVRSLIQIGGEKSKKILREHLLKEDNVFIQNMIKEYLRI
ncbi:MAG: HEAT repeat domain-containing protein [Acidobacteriota bacterium]|nr:HEAT repeat domain-containing protein [Thermoanaerobaculaceae bacterium]